MTPQKRDPNTITQEQNDLCSSALVWLSAMVISMKAKSPDLVLEALKEIESLGIRIFFDSCVWPAGLIPADNLMSAQPKDATDA